MQLAPILLTLPTLAVGVVVVEVSSVCLLVVVVEAGADFLRGRGELKKHHRLAKSGEGKLSPDALLSSLSRICILPLQL